MTARTELPGKVCALLRAPANVAIHGSPGSGKSWIGDRVIECLHAQNHRVIRVDLTTVMSGRDVFAEIARACGDLGLQPGSTGGGDSVHETWRLARRQVADADFHIALVLDQFDRVLRFDDAQEFLLLFRELVHRPEALHCTALMMSRRSLQSIEAKVRGISTLASVCYTEYLGSLRPADLDALGPGATGLTDTEKMSCLKWSGGHPALAKYWLTTRPDYRPDPSADLERARLALRVLDHLDDLQLTDAAAQLILGPIISDMLFERQELQLLGILPASDFVGDPVDCLSDQDVFREALRHRTWNMDPWGILGHAEVRLRGVIDVVLGEAHGEKWPDVVAKRSPAVASALDEARVKMDRDQRMFARQAPWLSYTYPGDLWSIIQVEWERFTAVFDTHDKAHWRRVITGLAQYRAPLAHGRPEVLGEAQRTQCRLFAEQVIEKVSQYDSSKVGHPLSTSSERDPG